MTPIQEVVQVLKEFTGHWEINEDDAAYYLRKMLQYAEQSNHKGLQCVIRHAFTPTICGMVDFKKLEFGNPWKDYA